MTNSKSKYFGDLCYSVREYETQDGVRKKVWQKAGAVFKNTESNRLSIKFETLPFGLENWSGWMTIFPEKNKDNKSSKQNELSASDIPGDPINIDDIPF